MTRIHIVVLFCLGGALSAWVGYLIGNSPSANREGDVRSGGVADPGQPLVGAAPSRPTDRFDFKTARSQLRAALRRVDSERSDAAYIEFNEAFARFPQDALPKLLLSVESMRDEPERDRLLRLVIPKLAKRNPQQMYDYCIANGLDEYMVSVFEEWAKRDPAGAWDALDRFSSDDTRRQKLANRKNYGRTIFQEWSQTDLDGAMAKAAEIDEVVLGSAVSGFWPAMEVAASREVLLQLIADMPEDPQVQRRELFVEFAAVRLAADDRPAAYEWLHSSGVGTHWLNRAELQMMTGWDADPQAEAEWLYATIRDDGSDDRMQKTDHIATSWGSRDREACIAWLEERGEQKAADQARRQR